MQERGQSTAPFQPNLGWKKDQEDVRDHFWTALGDAGAVNWQEPQKAAYQIRSNFTHMRASSDSATSTALACLAAVEYLDLISSGTTKRRSAALLCSLSRRLAGVGYDGAITIRDTLKTLARFGAPAESCWPLQGHSAMRPADVQFAFRGDCRHLGYARLDAPDMFPRQILKSVKKCTWNDVPVVFGFDVHYLTSREPELPRRGPFYALGGAAAVACGFDDARRSLWIRSTWGTDWGDQGYGWLPYKYIAHNHAADFWVVYRREGIARPPWKLR